MLHDRSKSGNSPPSPYLSPQIEASTPRPGSWLKGIGVCGVETFQYHDRAIHVRMKITDHLYQWPATCGPHIIFIEHQITQFGALAMCIVRGRRLGTKE